eukprot:m.321375 g.321375  ORF g.321375 m.321375 type:complete len:63 (-) comp20334_c0_seq1:1837-2025(-)
MYTLSCATINACLVRCIQYLPDSSEDGKIASFAFIHDGQGFAVGSPHKTSHHVDPREEVKIE